MSKYNLGLNCEESKCAKQLNKREIILLLIVHEREIPAPKHEVGSQNLDNRVTAEQLRAEHVR